MFGEIRSFQNQVSIEVLAPSVRRKTGDLLKLGTLRQCIQLVLVAVVTISEGLVRRAETEQVVPWIDLAWLHGGVARIVEARPFECAPFEALLVGELPRGDDQLSAGCDPLRKLLHELLALGESGDVVNQAECDDPIEGCVGPIVAWRLRQGVRLNPLSLDVFEMGEGGLGQGDHQGAVIEAEILEWARQAAMKGDGKSPVSTADVEDSETPSLGQIRQGDPIPTGPRVVSGFRKRIGGLAIK